MKKTPLLALFLLPATAQAALLAYEGFDAGSYNVGGNPTGTDYATDDLDGQGSGAGSGFTSGWVQDPGLSASYGGRVFWAADGGVSSADNYTRADAGQASYTSGGNSLNTTSGQAVYQSTLNSAHQVSFQRNYRNSNDSSLFVSTLVTLDGSSGVSIGFLTSNTSGGDHRPFHFGFQDDGTLFAAGAASGSHGLDTGTAYGPGTYFLVAELIDSGTTNDTINLWVNPVLGGPLGAADLTLDGADGNMNFYVSGTSSPQNAYDIFGLVIDFDSTGSSTGSTSVDEIRIGNTYADVSPFTPVPEPATSLLASLAALALLRRVRP